MLEAIKNWFLKRQIKSLEKSLEIIELWGDKVANPEFKETLEKFSDELLTVETIFRGRFSEEERKSLLYISNALEQVWRTYNLPVDERTARVDAVIESKELKVRFSLAKNALTRLLGEYISDAAPASNPKKTERSLVDGIWNYEVVLAMDAVHRMFERAGYCFVGGIAIQLYCAENSNILRNAKLKSVCRPTHDLDVVLPEGTNFVAQLPNISLNKRTVQNADYEITIERQGEKRPVLRVKLVDEATMFHETVIPLNITNSYHGAIETAPESYSQLFQTMRTVVCWYGNQKFTFNVVSPEWVILGKINRLAEKDVYDILLLLRSVPKIDYSYVQTRANPEKYLEFMKKIFANHSPAKVV